MNMFEIKLGKCFLTDIISKRVWLKQAKLGKFLRIATKANHEKSSLYSAAHWVRLHRLYWGKVWNFVEKDAKIVALAWNPNGKVLAVGNSNGIMSLIEIEKCNLLHTNNIGYPVVSLEWIETCEPNMSILLVGCGNGSIKLFVNGLFNVMSIDEKDGLEISGSCAQSLFMPKSLRFLATIHSQEREDGIQPPQKTLKFYKCELISSRTNEVKMVAIKFEKIDSLLKKLDEEVTQISDSWENNLQKVSLKLDKLAEIIPEDTSVLEEFLMAFAFGTLSAELQSFLVNDLTMKGLKKLGSDINASYGSLTSKVVDNLQGLCYDISIEMTELLGMARWYEKYGILGLNPDAVQDSLNYLGSFVLKIKELLAVIESDLRSFRAFFKWLSGVIYRLSDEPIPGIYREFSQEDNAHTLAFLQTQLVKDKDQKSFVLERIGQYLKEDEKFPKEVSSSNPWYNFLESEKSFQDNPLIIVPEKESSLPNIGKQLHKKIFQIFDTVTVTMAESFTSMGDHSITTENDDHTDHCCSRVSWFERGDNQDISACVLPCTCGSNNFYFITLHEPMPSIFNISKLCIDLTSITQNEKDGIDRTIIKDIKFYNDDNITLLVTEVENCDASSISVLAQIDTSHLKNVPSQQSFESSWPATNISDSILKWRYIESFDPFSFSVSGARKVACLLSSNRRRIRIYDMDAEEEDDVDQSDDDSQLEEL